MLVETDERLIMTKKVPLGIIEKILVKIDKFLFSLDFEIINMLKTSNETMILGRPFLATIHAEIDVFNKETSLGIRDDRIIFEMNKKRYEFTTPIEKAYMVNAAHGKDLMDIDCDLFLYESESYDDTDEGWEDSEKCGEEKIDAILDTVFDKLDDSWFSGETQDEDDLDGITDYLEPTSYNGFIDSDDEAYKERLCNFLDPCVLAILKGSLDPVSPFIWQTAKLRITKVMDKSFGWLILHSYNQDTLTSRFLSNWDPWKYRTDLECRFGSVNIRTLIKRCILAILKGSLDLGVINGIATVPLEHLVAKREDMRQDLQMIILLKI
ncbi:hypothetical protein Tco_0673652 [Tanacetum coccineum]